MAGTRLVAVRSALVAALADLPALADVEVAYQWRLSSDSRERVWTRRGQLSHTSASMRAGRNYRDEVGRFEVAIFAEGAGMSQEDVSGRVADLSLVVEEWVADHKNDEIGVTGVQTLTVDGDGVLTEAYTDSAYAAEIALPIRYTARLT